MTIHHPSLHFFTKEQRCRTGLCIFTITFILEFLVCVPFGTPFLHLFIFNDFSFLFLYFYGNVLIHVVK